MQGSTRVPFSTLFADTVRTHGVAWAMRYYLRRGMPVWEVQFWLRACGALALSVTLTACGGGGSTSEPDAPTIADLGGVVASTGGLQR